MTKMTPDEPGLPPRSPWATYLFRGLLIGALMLIAMWLLFEVMRAPATLTGQP